MPRVGEPQAKCGRKHVPIAPLQRLQQLDDSADVVLAIQRLDRKRGARVPAEVTGVFLLNVQAIAKHDGRQVSRCRCAVDWTPKSRSKQAWQVAGMIDMGVRKDDGIELPWSASEVAILGI